MFYDYFINLLSCRDIPIIYQRVNFIISFSGSVFMKGQISSTATRSHKSGDFADPCGFALSCRTHSMDCLLFITSRFRPVYVFLAH